MENKDKSNYKPLEGKFFQKLLSGELIAKSL